MSALSEQAQHFLDTAFKLALHDEFMGGPTAAERQRIEAIRAELDALITNGEWEVVPQSLEYDLITHAIHHGEIPQGYRVCRRNKAGTA